MSWFTDALQTREDRNARNRALREKREGRKGRGKASPMLLSDDPDKMRQQLKTLAIREYFKTADRGELAKAGRQALMGVIGADSDPKKTMEMELLENDEEYRAMRREQMLEEHAAELEMLRAKVQATTRGGGRRRRGGGGFDDDDDEDEGGRGRGGNGGGIEGIMQEYMETMLLEKLQGGGQEKEGLMERLAPILTLMSSMLAPMLTGQGLGGQPGQGQARVLPQAPGQLPGPGLVNTGLVDQNGQPIYAPPAPPVVTATQAPYPAYPPYTQGEGQPQQLGQVYPATDDREPEGEDVPLLFDVYGPDHIRQLLGHPDKAMAGAIAWAGIQEAMEDMQPLEQKKTDITARTMVKLPYAVAIMMLGTFKVYPEWAPIIAYIEGHEQEFTAFQKAISEAIEGRGPKLPDPDEGDGGDGGSNRDDESGEEYFARGGQVGEVAGRPAPRMPEGMVL